ncbi:homeobox transcription factor [Histoplasma capsulatum H143]|uniref:Homeobox transcription factor n=1 Tax=Ajellomyces capsulatus (strain H143) TaxID=544712 RepID=C6H8Z0_AJECH|nr:homeobox transcription factor [Histoplasma capsulatum H143]
MAPFISTIPICRVNASWHNQQLECPQTGSEPRSFRLFPTVMKDHSPLQINVIEQKEQKVHLSVPPVCETIDPLALHFKDNGDSEAQNEISNKRSILPQAKMKYLEGELEFSMRSTSTNSTSGASLIFNRIESDNIETNDDDTGDDIDINIGIDQFKTHVDHEGLGQRQSGGQSLAKTTIDRLKAKRRMKRFRQTLANRNPIPRLSHNRTRFLMSEFTRQAHPDAAHRERLSKEIPGLSPRQEQIWFQNRRAKLKRLTSDDREKALIPRTLPDGFDITEDIYSLYRSWHQSSNNTLTPAGIYSNPIQEGGDIFTPLISIITRKPCDEDYTTSPLSASSGCDGYFPSPTSALATGSEHETHDNSSRFALFCNSQASALRYMSPSTRTSNFSHFSSQSYCHHVPDLFQPITANPRTVSLESSYEQNLSYSQTISGYGTPDATSPVLDMPYRIAVPDRQFEPNVSNQPPSRLHLNMACWKRGDHGLQSDPLPNNTANKDQVSPLDSTFSSNPCGGSYGKRNFSSLSLLASLIPF